MLRIGRRACMSTRIYDTALEAIEDIRSGSRIAVGGYGCCGVPENLLRSLRDFGNYDFTAYSMSCGVMGYGLDILLQTKQLKRVVTSFLGSSREIEKQYMNGEIELVLVPEGTLAERVRAAGAGIPGFWTKTGVNTIIEEGLFPIKYSPEGKGVQMVSPGKEKRIFNGQEHLLEQALNTDFSLIKAWKADKMGNLVYRKTAKNFNPEIAMCSRVTIAEVEQIVEPGEIEPDEIDTPGIFVNRLVKGEYYEKPIEHLTLQEEGGKLKIKEKAQQQERLRIAKRAACELKDGMYVNLGLGIPSMVSNFVPEDTTIFVHSPSGIVGAGAYPRPGEEDPDLVNTNRETISIIQGGATCSSILALDMLRGGHMDAVIVGGFQVSQKGDLANWVVPGKYVKGMGSSMDSIAHERTKLIVTMMHTHEGMPKVLKDCTLPLTGKRCVDLLITELGVFDFRIDGMTLIELAKGVSLQEVRDKTGCSFNVASDLRQMLQ